MKGFSKDLVSVRTAQAIRSKNKVIPLNDSLAIRLRKIVIRSNCLGYSLEKEMSSLPKRPRQSVREKVSSVQTARAIRSKKTSSVQTARVIRSKQLSAALLFKSLSPEPFTTNLSRNHVNLNNSCKRRIPSSYQFLRKFPAE